MIYLMFEYDIWHTEGNMYSTEEIEQMIASSKEDPQQEYLCHYSQGSDAVFGPVTDEDRHGATDLLYEWELRKAEQSVEAPEEYDEQQDPDGIYSKDSVKDTVTGPVKKPYVQNDNSEIVF